MYEITAVSKRVEKQLSEVLQTYYFTYEKLEKIRSDPRRELDAHKLKGKLRGLWACSFGYDLRMIYRIDDDSKQIVVFGIGSHKVYL